MASQSTWRQGAAALRLAGFLTALSLSGGCQNDELAHTKHGVGGALAPISVDEYARRHGVSAKQARQELQQKVGEHDARTAIEKIDEIGTTRE